ncbi:V-type ATP synthase subunit D [Salinispira pacifica]
MAEMLDVNPTRGVLLKLKEDLGGIQTRHDLLDRKREVLIRELMERLDQARELEKRQQELFEKAHRGIQVARMRMGSDLIEWINLSPTARVKVDIDVSTVMGLRIAAVDLNIEPVLPPYGLGDTSAALDEARQRWLDVLRFLADASETFSSVWRLAMELRKTQRQVNALESTIIPRYQRTIGFIEERLEEDEREDIVHAKKIKEIHSG